jgi:hypothetical protein
MVQPALQWQGPLEAAQVPGLRIKLQMISLRVHKCPVLQNHIKLFGHSSGNEDSTWVLQMQLCTVASGTLNAQFHLNLAVKDSLDHDAVEMRKCDFGLIKKTLSIASQSLIYHLQLIFNPTLLPLLRVVMGVCNESPTLSAS